MNKPKRANPLWETIVLFSSFVLLWLWFLASQNARAAQEQLSPLWQVVLGAALLVLIVVTARRIGRVKRAFSGEDEEVNDGNETPSGVPPLPFMPPTDNRRK